MTVVCPLMNTRWLYRQDLFIILKSEEHIYSFNSHNACQNTEYSVVYE
jgi:hypothetical protein